MVGRADLRITEAAKLGFRRFVIPAGNVSGLKVRQQDLKIIGVRDVSEAMEAVFV